MILDAAESESGIVEWRAFEAGSLAVRLTSLVDISFIITTYRVGLALLMFAWSLAHSTVIWLIPHICRAIRHEGDCSLTDPRKEQVCACTVRGGVSRCSEQARQDLGYRASHNGNFSFRQVHLLLWEVMRVRGSTSYCSLCQCAESDVETAAFATHAFLPAFMFSLPCGGCTLSQH